MNIPSPSGHTAKRRRTTDIGEQSTSGIRESTLIEPVQIGIIIKHEFPPGKTTRSDVTLCFANIVQDLGRNCEKMTQKASIVTDIVAKYLKIKRFLQTEVEAQTGLHFEAFYMSWISLAKK